MNTRVAAIVRTPVKLCEGHEKTVGELINIGYDPADYVSVRVGIDIGYRKALDLFEGIASYVADDAEGDLIVYHCHQPLGDSADAEDYRGFREPGNNSGYTDIVFSDNEVDRIADDNRDDKCCRRAYNGKGESEDNERLVMRNIRKRFFKPCG